MIGGSAYTSSLACRHRSNCTFTSEYLLVVTFICGVVRYGNMPPQLATRLFTAVLPSIRTAYLINSPQFVVHSVILLKSIPKSFAPYRVICSGATGSVALAVTLKSTMRIADGSGICVNGLNLKCVMIFPGHSFARSPVVYEYNGPENPDSPSSTTVLPVSVQVTSISVQFSQKSVE